MKSILIAGRGVGLSPAEELRYRGTLSWKAFRITIAPPASKGHLASRSTASAVGLVQSSLYHVALPWDESGTKKEETGGECPPREIVNGSHASASVARRRSRAAVVCVKFSKLVMARGAVVHSGQ